MQESEVYLFQKRGVSDTTVTAYHSDSLVPAYPFTFALSGLNSKGAETTSAYRRGVARTICRRASRRRVLAATRLYTRARDTVPGVRLAARNRALLPATCAQAQRFSDVRNNFFHADVEH